MDRIVAELSESPATSADDTNTGSGEHHLFFDSSSRRAVASLERLEFRPRFGGLVLVP